MSFTTTPVNTVENPVIQAEINHSQKSVSTQLPQETKISADTSTLQPPKEEVFSERFAKLAKAQKQIQREREMAKNLHAEAVRKEQALLERETRIKEFESIKQSNPLKALEMLGLDYNALSQVVLNNGNIPPELQVQAVRKEIEELRQQRELEKQEAQKLAQEAQEAELNSVLENFQNHINSYVSAKKDEFELINLFDQSQLVYTTIQEHFNKTGQVLSTHQACDLVEKELENTASKMKTAKKFNKLFAIEQKKEEPVRPQSLSKTLSNNLTSSAPSMLPAKVEGDRFARAMAALG